MENHLRLTVFLSIVLGADVMYAPPHGPHPDGPHKFGPGHFKKKLEEKFPELKEYVKDPLWIEVIGKHPWFYFKGEHPLLGEEHKKHKHHEHPMNPDKRHEDLISKMEGHIKAFKEAVAERAKKEKEEKERKEKIEKRRNAGKDIDTPIYTVVEDKLKRLLKPDGDKPSLIANLSDGDVERLLAIEGETGPLSPQAREYLMFQFFEKPFLVLVDNPDQFIAIPDKTDKTEAVSKDGFQWKDVNDDAIKKVVQARIDAELNERLLKQFAYSLEQSMQKEKE